MIFRILIILGIIIFSIIYSVHKRDALQNQLAGDSSKSVAVLSNIPLSNFSTLDGKALSIEKFYQDKKPDLLVVHFWGTWCAPCEEELPDLIKFIKSFKPEQNVVFFLVAVNDEDKKVKKRAKQLDESSENIIWLMDNNNIHKKLFGTTRVPETYVFSSGMNTLRKFIGPQEWLNPQYFQTFTDLLEISRTKM